MRLRVSVTKLTCSTLTNNVQALSGIEYAPKYETLDIPNDYTTIISPSAYALDLINAPAAWDITHGDTNIYVAISDQNIHDNHPDLIDEIIYNNPSIIWARRDMALLWL